MSTVLEARSLYKSFPNVEGPDLSILSGIDLTLATSETVAVVGASGSGKSTLLNLLGALDEPSDGEIFIEGQSYSNLDEFERDTLRNEKIGFVFQFHHLLREFSALENVMMPMLIGGATESKAREMAAVMLEEVGLGSRLNARPTTLSGGEQQRCAVARALSTEPRVVLADEPSGNLDNHNSEILHDLLFSMTQNHGTALLVVTHNQALSKRCDRVLLLDDGGLRPLDSEEALP